jgi:glycosyltransferase involved in cell wall biosynthesis
MRISVVVPTSSRAAALARTLPSLLQQTFPAGDYEVLVVENGPESGARRVTRRAERRHADRSLRYLHEPTPGLLSGRHRGALEARGEIVVFADDDIDAAPGWLVAIAETFADPEIHFVGGRNLPRYEVPPPSWVEGFWYTPPAGGRACIYLSLLDLGEEMLPIDANYVWGLNFAVRRSTLFELGGFHPDNIPDHLQHFQGDGETGLTMKANERGLRAVYQPLALIHHRISTARLTVEYFEKRAFYQGVCDSYTAIRRSPENALAGSVEPGSRDGRRTVRPENPPAARWRRWVAHWLPEPSSAASISADEAHARVRAAYDAGFRFHLEAARGSSKLLEWVLREEYWDYRLPEL